MTKKVFSFCLIITSILSANAHAESYECIAKENPNFGFPSEFSILVDSTQVGGQILLKANNTETVLGMITETGIVDKNQGDAFELVLGFISEESVSGISVTQLSQVNKIEVYRSEAADGNEILVYKLLNGTIQLGGTVMISGMGTACLPK